MVRDNTFNRIRAPDRGGWIKRNWILCAVKAIQHDRLRQDTEITFKYYQFIEANSAEEFASNMNAMAEMSFYDTGVKAAWGDQLLTLSTCDSREEDGRFVVVAKRVK